MNGPNDTWESRPKGLGDSELIAWSLTEVAEALSGVAIEIGMLATRNGEGESE